MRAINFGAGPAMLPEEVLQKAKEELLDWHGSGMSVMEMSHRGKEFISIAENAEKTLRRVLKISQEYKVLFLQGGATLQFSVVPINLLRGKRNADYVHTGVWAEAAIKEAKRLCKVNIAASSQDRGSTYIPKQSEWKSSKDSAYLHYTANETINGTEFGFIPESEIPLVSDMSSNLLSRELEVKKFGLIYGGAQKNMGIAGLTIVIIREDLLSGAPENTPIMLDYKTHAEKESMHNTPPCFSWYISGLYFEWIVKIGLKEIEKRNSRKADILYKAIDTSEGFYKNPIEKDSRSRMNVIFHLKNGNLEDMFSEEAKKAGLAGLKGHRSVGGMRTSLYNAVTEEHVKKLASFMEEFQEKNS